MLQLKVFLAGRVAVETDGVVIDDARFPGRQGRLLFAYLVAERGRPVPRDELAEALWGEAPPATWDKAMTVIASKLRGLLVDRGIDGANVLTCAFGCYRLDLPEGTWVDVIVTADAAQEAEQALAAGDLEKAKAAATLAASLVQQPFLPGEEGAWVEGKRREIDDVRGRALSVLADACLRSGDAREAAKWAEQATALEPFRETGYRLLMEAHVAAGNGAEALQAYGRCRRLLAEELGAYPSPETEAVYLEILRSSPRDATAEVDQIDIEGISESPPPPAISQPAKRDRRKLVALAVAALLVAGFGALTLMLTGSDAAPPAVLPNSVVRIDPDTLKPTQVVRVGSAPDLVVVAGGFVWVTHRGRRYADSSALRNAGDRTLTRIDPSTGHRRPVGGGLAPCGLAADPSGDVWVANCFAAGSGPSANVVRVDAKTLEFTTWPVPAGVGYFRGLAYGGGSLWVADVSGAVDYHGITQVDPRTGAPRRIALDRHAGWLAWSEGYGDLWMNDFDRGSVSRLNPATGDVKTFESVGTNPASPVVYGDAVWVGDWENPQLVRLPAVGSGRRRHISLPVKVRPAGVTTVAAGAGSVWATVPDSHALWRIDPKTNHVTRIAMKYFPWGVAAGDNEVWVAVRGKLDG